jgi:hypothetical protein
MTRWAAMRPACPIVAGVDGAEAGDPFARQFQLHRRWTPGANFGKDGEESVRPASA